MESVIKDQFFIHSFIFSNVEKQGDVGPNNNKTIRTKEGGNEK
jgi:hypothetical protein